jgi:hypothetical protein
VIELVRYSDIRLTTNICRRLELTDTAVAVNLLPAPKTETEARTTGTDAARAWPARKGLNMSNGQAQLPLWRAAE